MLTGFQCPGCGSQRAIHSLLNLDFHTAFQHNALLLISIPYIILGSVFELIKAPTQRSLKIRKILFGQKAIWLIFTIIILFWILRNIF